MAICKECGAEIENNKKFCRNCGAVVQLEEDFSQTISNIDKNIDSIEHKSQVLSATNYVPYQTQNSIENNPSDFNTAPILSTKSILGGLLLLFFSGIFTCGIAPLIILIVWACNNENLTKRNFARAALIFSGILLGIYFVVFLVIIAVGITLSQNGVFDLLKLFSF